MVDVVLLRHVALFVDEMVDRASLGSVRTGKVLEVKTFLLQLLPRNVTFSVGVQFLQYVAVACQNAVDFANEIDLLVGLLVIIAIAARVAAELLVDAPDKRLAAVETFLSFFFHLIQLFVIQF